MSDELPSMATVSQRTLDLLTEADALGLGITWRATPSGWRCRARQLNVPHLAEGPTMADALEELLRFARKVLT